MFNRLKRQYNTKYKIFNDNSLKRLIAKAHNQLLNGEEISWKVVKEYSNGDFSLDKLLVDLVLIEELKKEFKEILDKISDLHVKKIKVIYGEYGQGKSQTAQILQEWLIDDQRFPQLIPIYQSVSILPKLYWHISHKVREKVLGKPLAQDLAIHLKHLSFDQSSDFFTLTSMDTVHYPFLIDEFNNLILKLTQFGYTPVLILDELAKIVSRPEEWKPWGDLFTSLKNDMNLLIIILVPARISQEILKIDSRMERWSVPFNFDATYLTGLVQDKVPEFVGNILAMSAVNDKLKIDKYLEFADACINAKLEWLESAEIRSVNMWAIHLSKILEALVNINFDKVLSKFFNLSEQRRGQALEANLRKFLLVYQFPDNKQKMDDETHLFKSYYKTRNLYHDRKNSDGHIVLEKIINNQVVDTQEIAVEIKYTTQGEHSEDEIKKLQTLSKGYPLIFISIGSNEVHIKFLQEEVKKWQKSILGVIPNFPILIIHIPDVLYQLLLLLEENLKGQKTPKYVNLIRIWSQNIVKFVFIIQDFLANMPELLIDRKMKIRLNEAKLLTADVSVIKPANISSLEGYVGSHPAEPVANKSNIVEKNAISTLCSYIDTNINKYKLWNTFQREINVEVKKTYPESCDCINGNLEGWLGTLRDKDMAKKSKWGQKFAVFKLDKWDFKKALNLLVK